MSLVGKERRSDYLPWPRAIGLLPNPQLEAAESKELGYQVKHDSHCTILQVGIKDYVRCLEAAIIATLSEYGIEGYTTENTGVWVNHPSKGESKLCSIGERSHDPKCKII